MPAKKYFRKSAKKAVAFAKKRYRTRTGGVKVAQLARDVMKIKRSLNVEHKHIDFKFGSGQTVTTQHPTNNTPIVLPLPVPARGVAFNNRVGNQIRIVHITSKLLFTFTNNTDLINRTTCSVRLLFAKSGDDVPTINDLYELDSNGHYTRNSFTNVQSWKKYNWIKPLNSYKSHQESQNRYAETVADATRVEPKSPNMHLSKFYINKACKTSVKVMFENGSDTVITQMKPYLLFMSDTIDSSLLDYDPVGISGTIRLTYVDN